MSNRSFLSKIVERILKFTKPTYMNSQEEIELFLENKSDDVVKTVFNKEELNGVEVVSIGKHYNDDNIMVFVHGGAYVNQLNYQHILYCYILSKVLKKRVILPVYPLAPLHDYNECYNVFTSLYTYLIDKYSSIALMGDSAGGGFVLSFCQYLNTINLRQPDNIIVFSPWVDISMNNSYDDSDDPILGVIGLKEIGKRWANDLDTVHYKVSPYYGDNHDLPRTLIITGSNEIFYKDIKQYYRKLVNDGVSARLIVGDDLFHIYPLFPIPEALTILKEIKKEMNP